MKIDLKFRSNLRWDDEPWNQVMDGIIVHNQNINCWGFSWRPLGIVKAFNDLIFPFRDFKLFKVAVYIKSYYLGPFDGTHRRLTPSSTVLYPHPSSLSRRHWLAIGISRMNHKSRDLPIRPHPLLAIIKEMNKLHIVDDWCD